MATAISDRLAFDVVARTVPAHVAEAIALEQFYDGL
jgi:hypothetical protein